MLFFTALLGSQHLLDEEEKIRFLVGKVLCKTAYNQFDRWVEKGLWAVFLSYEVKLIRSKYSPTDVTSVFISIPVEFGME